MTDTEQLLSPAEQEALAQRLLVARDSGQGIDPPSDTIDYTFRDAYRIRRLLVDKLIARGHRPVGHKIGFTAKAMQEMYGMTGPDFGQLLDYMDASGQDPVRVSNLSDTRVEPEVAFVLREPLRGRVGLMEVLEATDYVTGAIEIIGRRLDRRQRRGGSVRPRRGARGTARAGPCCPAHRDGRRRREARGHGSGCHGSPRQRGRVACQQAR